MAGPVLKACKNCNFISEDDICPRCGGQTSKEWQGYVAIIDHTKSEIAKRMSIKANGRYALKVR
ncbi:MAG: transcription elongation factor subunit Spt4 [Candidatus Methanomethylophilaceae archaeon]|jgi:DNA-directed RNA polymerase subunit E"